MAWATSEDTAGDVKVMDEWPGTDENRLKVPTTIATGSAISDEDDIDTWGYGVTPQIPSSSWFKLIMAENEHVVPQDDPLLRQVVGQGLLAIPEGSNAEDLCQQYLHLLHAHVMRKADQRWGCLLETTPIRYVMTIPADWGGTYKEKLEKAAAAAGIARNPKDKIMVTSEPEAAARATFQAPIDKLSKGVFEIR